uniref:Alpha-carbonic anhydrase domain-containing protein n=1 Tax=Setaria digitata TaxID=48799 RepID=A0A915PFL9_9BILA
MSYIILFLATFYPQLRSLRMNDYPWTYDNDLLGGPDFWGLLSKKWKMCTKGKMQSPINIKPASILYDPRLSDIKIDRVSTVAEMMNTGQMPRLRLLHDTYSSSVNITGGPLRPYKYRLQRVDFHYSNDEMTGSEHAINSRNFPMEIQLITYNTDLYANFTTALTLPRGIAAVSIIVLVGGHTNEELLKITDFVQKVPFKSNDQISLLALNKWRKLQRTTAEEKEPQYVAPNFRPLQHSYGRLIRTNIINRNTSMECKRHITVSRYRSNLEPI